MRKNICFLLLLFLALPTLMAQRVIREGLEALRQENYEDATKLLQEAIKTYPNDQKAYLYLYFAYMAQKEYTLAEGILLAGVEIPGPDTSELYYHLGNLMFQRGEWNFAVKYYTRSLELQENYSPSLLNRANALVEAGSALEQSGSDYTKAWEDFRLAILDYSTFLSLNTSTPQKEEIKQMVSLLKSKEQELLDLQKAKDLAQAQAGSLACGSPTVVSGEKISNEICEKGQEEPLLKDTTSDSSKTDLTSPNSQKQEKASPASKDKGQESASSSSSNLPASNLTTREKNIESSKIDNKANLVPSQNIEPPMSNSSPEKPVSQNKNHVARQEIEKTPPKQVMPKPATPPAQKKENKISQTGMSRTPTTKSTNNSVNTEQQGRNEVKQKLLNSLFYALKEDTLLLKQKNLLDVQEFNEEITIDE